MPPASCSRAARPRASSSARRKGLEIAHAGREVIVSGGAYGSPQLLQLSGVGPAQHLTDMGIQVVHDMPGVGSNLQDHFNTYCTYRISKDLSLNALHYSLRHRLIAGAQYVFLRSGPMSGNGMYVGALVRSDKRLERPDLQFNISAWSTIDRTADGIISHPFPGISISPVHLAPEGRGTVRLKSSDPLAPPEIRFNFLRSESDMRVMIAGVRIARSIARQHALQQLVVEETAPGVATQTDEEIAADVRQRGVSNLHPVGTCGMGQGPMAVVDPRLRVHGIAGLACGRCLDHARDRRRQHQRADDHDCRESIRHDPGGCPSRGVITGRRSADPRQFRRLALAGAPVPPPRPAIFRASHAISVKAGILPTLGDPLEPSDPGPYAAS